MRFAQVTGRQLGCASCQGGAQQLGALSPEASSGGLPETPTQCPLGWPDGVPCPVTSTGAGSPAMPIVTEQQAAEREAAAFERGRREEQGSVIKTAAISAAVSAVVGIVIGKFLG